MNLDEGAVRRLLRTEEVIPAMERALADFSGGKVVQPVRTMLPVAENDSALADPEDSFTVAVLCTDQ